MIYLSHFDQDKKIQELVDEYGVEIETITFAVGDNLDRLEDCLKEFEGRVSCKSLNMHGPFLDLNPASYDYLIAEAGRQRYQQTYEAAKRLNANRIVFHSTFLPNVYFIQGWAEKMAGFWNDFLKDKDDSIKISMENVLDVEYQPLCDVFDLVEHEAFSLCLDVGHAHCYSKYTVEEWVAALGSRIGHVHIHDNDSSWDHHDVLGRGTIDWENILPMLYGLGIRSYTIEHSYVEKYKDSIEFLKQNFDYLF